MVWEMLFEEFQDGGCGSHLGYQNGRILAILNLHVATILPTKFQLNPIYGSVCRKYEKLTRDNGQGELLTHLSPTSFIISILRVQFCPMDKVCLTL